jgi:hypothetical protein
LVTGGTSFAGLSAAVKLIVLGGAEGADGLLLPQAAPSKAVAATIAYRFIVIVPLKTVVMTSGLRCVRVCGRPA